jgi:hypothetical protein
MKKFTLLVCFALPIIFGACSSSPPVKSQAYANLPNHRMMEYDFPVVWKGIEAATRNLKVVDRDPSEVGVLEMNKLSHRTLETDWLYAQSRDKYEEYQSNGSPRKIYLQTRIKYKVDARKVMGGTEVSVKTQEEIERLKSDGTSGGYETSNTPDPSRANEMVEKINGAILSAAP